MTTLSLRASSSDSENSTFDILYVQLTNVNGRTRNNDFYISLKFVRWGTETPRGSLVRGELRTAAITDISIEPDC